MAFSLLLLGHVVFLLAVNGVHANPRTNLTCTNDSKRMFCQLKRKNCSEYRLTLQNDSGYGNESCVPQQCGTEQCCCDVEMTMDLVFGESHTATVWRGDKSLESKTIWVQESFKPRTPTITSVNETNGNFGVNWRTNMEESSSIPLTAQITYYKKGDPEKPWTPIMPATVDLTGGKLQHFEISGQHLERSTTYVVRVRSVSDLSDIVSDSSKEWEFTTPASGNALLLAIIITLSLAAIIISAAMYCCFVKLKTNWWDKLPNPKISVVHPVKEMMLQPEKSWPSPICIDQRNPDEDKKWLQMPYADSECSGSECSSRCSSHISYADAPVDIPAVIAYNLSKIFPKISPVSQLQKSPCTSKDSGLFSAPFISHGNKYDGSTSGSSDLVNPSYSLLIPNSSNNTLPDTPEVQTQTELNCDFSYHSSQMDTMNVSAQDASPLLPIDPYQQYNTDPQRFSYAEDPSSSSMSSGTTASCESRVESSSPASTSSSLPNKNPFHVFMLPGSQGSVVLEDDYQPIQNLVTQPDVLFSEERGGDQEGDLVKYPEKPFSKIPQSCFNPFLQDVGNDAPRGLSQQKLQSPFLFLISADNCMPVSTVSDYHSV